MILCKSGKRGKSTKSKSLGLTTNHLKAIQELVNLAGGEEKTAAAIIQQSMAKGWKGFFALKKEANGTDANKTVTGQQLNEAHLKHFGK
jgi:hypothetical protein